MAHRIKDGWRLYYSDEGYPYYFNELTGESEWASTSEAEQHSTQQIFSPADDNEGVDNRIQDEDENSSERADEEYGEDASALTADEESNASDSSGLDAGFNEKFKAFLRTPEGIEAVLAEQERIAQYVEKKSKLAELEQDREYARVLTINKKDDDKPNRSGLTAAWDAFGTFLGIRDPASPPKSKSQRSSVEKATRGRYDEFGREAKQRAKPSRHDPAPFADDLEGGGSPALSRSSSSSDLNSLSSEDSDVAVINAPLFSELPPWLRPATLYERLLVPFQDFLQRQGVIASSSSVAEYVRTRGYDLVGNLAQQSIALVQQGTAVAGAALAEWSVAAWTGAQPYIVHFMQTVVDAPVEDTPAARRSQLPLPPTLQARSFSEPTEGDAAVDAVSELLERGADSEGWKTLPVPEASELPPLPRPPSAPASPRPPTPPASAGMVA